MTATAIQRDRLSDDVDDILAASIVSDIASHAAVVDAKGAAAERSNATLRADASGPLAVGALDVLDDGFAVGHRRRGRAGLVHVGVAAAFGHALQRIARVSWGGGVGLRGIRPQGPGNLGAAHWETE